VSRAYAAACGMASICELTHARLTAPRLDSEHGMGLTSRRRIRRCNRSTAPRLDSASPASSARSRWPGSVSARNSQDPRWAHSRRSWAPPRSPPISQRSSRFDNRDGAPDAPTPHSWASAKSLGCAHASFTRLDSIALARVAAARILAAAALIATLPSCTGQAAARLPQRRQR